MMDYHSAPGSGMCKVIPETRMPAGVGDESRQRLATEAAAQHQYVKNYRAGGSAEKPEETWASLARESMAAENLLRQKFAQDREHPELADPYCGLLPVHPCEDIFHCRDLSAEEASLPKVFPLPKRRTGKAVVSKAEFQNNFDTFTEGMLRNLNWDNVFAAGGSILAALLPLPEKAAASRQTKRLYYHHEAYKGSDIDLFFYGLDEKQANEKLKEIYFLICDAFPDPTMQPVCFRTSHAVTIVSKFPYRHVQVVLRLYKSPAEVLVGFDVDSCSVGFDGSSVWMTPRCHNSLTAQYNSVDMTRRSPTYEVRLAKYAERGMEVLVPCLDQGRVDPQIYETPFEKSKGLLRLLLLEKLKTPQQQQQYKQQQRLGRHQPLAVRQGPFQAKLQQDMQDEFIQGQLLDAQVDASDYQTVFLPWGPQWDADKVRNLVYTKDMLLNAVFRDPFQDGYRHLCFFGTAAEVIEDCAPNEPKIEGQEEKEEEDKAAVRGPIKWLDVDPGQQTIGSFHPITTGQWGEGVHISNATEHLVSIALSATLTAEAAEAAIENISPPVDSVAINAKDPAGRTPLILAVLLGSPIAVKAFIARGAMLNMRLEDGRSVLHLAAQYGKVEVLPHLFETGRKLNATLNEMLKSKEEEERAIARKQLEEDKELKKLMEEQGRREFYRALHKVKMRREREARERTQQLRDKGYLDKLDLDAEDYDQKMTPLMYAAFFGHLGVVRALLEEGADSKKFLDNESANHMTSVLVTRTSILTLACHNGHADVLAELLDRGVPAGVTDSQGRTPLHYAAHWGEVPCTVALLKCAASAQDKDQKKEGVSENVLNPHLADRESKTALLYAIEAGHTEAVELLVDSSSTAAGALAAASQVTSPVVAAVESLQSGALSVLLKRGGDPSTKYDGAQQMQRCGGFGGGHGMFGQPSAGLFGGGGGLFGHSHGASSRMTILDFVEAQMQQLQQQRKGLEIAAQRQETALEKPHISQLEYLDFLLGKTAGIFECFALTEFRLKAETAEEAANKQRGSAALFAPSSSETQVEAITQEQEKYQGIFEVLKQFGAKRFEDLEEQQQEAAGSAASGPQRKKMAKKSLPGKRRKRAGFRHQHQQPQQQVAVHAFKLGLQAPKQQPHHGGGGLFGGGGMMSSMQPGLQQGGSSTISFEERFEALKTPTGEKPSLDSRVGEALMQGSYKQLFDAVVMGDCDQVRSLCAGASDAEQLLVAVRSTLLQMTPLAVAMARGSTEMARCLLRLAVQQHTPEKLSQQEAGEISGVKLADSRLLQAGAQDKTFAQLMEGGAFNVQQLQEEGGFKRGGHKLLDKLEQLKAEEAGEDEDEEDAPLVSVCSAQALVDMQALEFGVKRKHYEAVGGLLSELDALNVFADKSTAESAPGGGGFAGGFNAGGGGPFGKGAPQRPRPGEAPLKMSSLLLRSRNLSTDSGPATPFEAAIVADDVKMAELLLEHGAPDCFQGEDPAAPSEPYTGLKVEGQKRESWALPPKTVLERKQLRRDRLRALHLAAAAGAEHSIEFLLGGGCDSFAMVGNEGDDFSDISVLASLFTLHDRDAQGQLVFHAAVQHNQVGALRKLLSIGVAQLKKDGLQRLLDDVGTKKKPHQLVLHTAVSAGKQACVEALLEHSASVHVADHSGRTALHIAVAVAENTEKNRDSKAKLLRTLLAGITAAAASKESAAVLAMADQKGNTALHKAVESHSEVAVAVLLETLTELGADKGRAVLNAKQEDGCTALHFAAQLRGDVCKAVVSALLQAGADTKALDNKAALPLHLAAAQRAPTEVLKMLLPGGGEGAVAGRGLEDVAGQTPLEKLMISQVQEFMGRLGERQPQPQDTGALPLLLEAEAAGRVIIDLNSVVQHANKGTAQAAQAEKTDEEEVDEEEDEEENE